MIDNYDDLTVDETLDAVSDFSDDELTEFVEFEKSNKNRTGVVEPLEAELESVDSDAEADESPTVVADPDTVEVTKAVGYGYVAGLWFDDVDETKTVERTSRVARAIEAGDLEVTE